MAKRSCKVTLCKRTFHAKDFCSMHYLRSRKGSVGDSSSVYRTARPKHGLSSSSEYGSWGAMITRCELPTSSEYIRYGAKGVKVCKRWRESFTAFYEDMGPKPTPNHSLDRINSEGNYEPNNCRWASPSLQSFNQARRKDNTSGYVGVKRAKNDKWAASIHKDSTKYSLGTFEDKEQAMLAYEVAAVQLHGEFKNLKVEAIRKAMNG